MGLEQFDVAPDNKGGRPEKEEQDSGSFSSRYDGRVLVEGDADKDWWEEVLVEAIGQEELPMDDFDEFINASSELSNHVHSQTINVWKSLEEHGVANIDWKWLKSECPDEWVDPRWPGEESITGSTSRFGSSGGSSAGEGLSSIIDAAK